MALTRRDFLYLVPVFAASAYACTAAGPGPRLSTGSRTMSVREPTSSSASTILAFTPETPQTREVITGLSDELQGNYRLVAVRLDSANEANVLAESIERYKPSALVLINNTSVTAYRRYQQLKGGQTFPPAVIVMASFLESQTAQLQCATGISYEVPLITAITNLRKLVSLSRERVGVVVRSPLREFVNNQVQLASREKVIVTQEEVDATPNPSEIKRAIRRLKSRADVLWILNDDRLLTPQLIADAWVPGLDERPWVPSIVGAPSLVSARNSFGTFAVLPDHAALGAQVSDMLDDIANNDWKVPGGAGIQLPVSTTTTIDLGQVKERFLLQPDALQQVDKIVE